MNTLLIISLGITLVFCALIYYFLRKRINSVDQKVNLLMQLVKEHHQQVQNQSHIIMQEKNYHHSNLINVSDDDEDDEGDVGDEGDMNNFDDAESGYSSDDSAEVSDNESVTEGKISVVNLTSPNDTLNLESISLSGAETTTQNNGLSDVSTTHSNETLNTETILDSSNLEEFDITLDELSLEEETNDDGQDTPQDQELEVKTINLSDLETTTDILQLNVAGLKNKCRDMGLEGYSNLRKQQLIELIQSKTATIGDNA